MNHKTTTTIRRPRGPYKKYASEMRRLCADSDLSPSSAAKLLNAGVPRTTIIMDRNRKKGEEFMKTAYTGVFVFLLVACVAAMIYLYGMKKTVQ